jgi:endo-1,4-beta-xylanase
MISKTIKQKFKNITMKKFIAAIFSVCLVLLLAEGCKSGKVQKQETNDQSKGLKDYYKDYFTIGVAVSPQALKRQDEGKLITEQFASMTPENAMKMGPIHPSEKFYFWRDADSIAAFAQRNKMKLRGHTLCWHNQTPRWLFTDSATGKLKKYCCNG